MPPVTPRQIVGAQQLARPSAKYFKPSDKHEQIQKAGKSHPMGMAITSTQKRPQIKKILIAEFISA